MNEVPILHPAIAEPVVPILPVAPVLQVIPIALATPSLIRQQYEEYWDFTCEYTDFNGEGFIGTLRICIDFIERYRDEEYSELKYSNLQDEVYEFRPKKDMGSVRKAINQLVKMGFINWNLISYHDDCDNYLNARTNRKRNFFLSKIVHSNSSLSRSVTKNSNSNEINFLIKTLEENGSLSKLEIIALMQLDIGKESKEYFTKIELTEYVKQVTNGDFIKRKYNQVAFLFGLLKKLDSLFGSLSFVKDELYFTEDAERVYGSEVLCPKEGRDQYLHRTYKTQLKKETISVFGSIQCMIDNWSHPVLIASHLKPFIECSDEEAYDPNNGLLLSRNLDSLVDLGYITFGDDGEIICSNKLAKEISGSLRNCKLDEKLLTDERKIYFDYHRKNVFEKKI